MAMEATDLLKTLETAFKRDIFYNDAMISLLFSNKINHRDDDTMSRPLCYFSLLIYFILYLQMITGHFFWLQIDVLKI